MVSVITALMNNREYFYMYLMTHVKQPVLHIKQPVLHVNQPVLHVKQPVLHVKQHVLVSHSSYDYHLRISIG